MRAAFLLVFVVLSAFEKVQSQLPDYHVRVFNESVGIKSYVIKSIVKDKNDFLWILDHDQVQKFDGRHVWNFKLNVPNYIFCDSKNRIWVTSYKQLYRYENDVDGFIPYPVHNLENNSLGTIFQLKDGKLYLQTATGFDVLDESAQEFRELDLGISHLHPIAVEQFDSFDQTIFFQVRDSVYAFNLSTRDIRSLPATDIYKLQAISNNKILLSRWDYVTFWYDFGKSEIKKIEIRKYFPNDPDTFLNIRRFVPLDRERFLVTSQKGLLEYNLLADSFKQLRLYYDGQPLNLYPSAVVYKDDQQNIWMSYEGGITRFNVSQPGIGLIRKVSNNNQSGWSNNIRGFIEDEKGNMWLVTVNGFAHWDLRSGEIQSYPLKQDKNKIQIFPSIRGLAYDGRFVILGPTDFGPWLYDVKKNAYRRPGYATDSVGQRIKSVMQTEFINQIYTLRNGDHLISAKFGLYLLNGKNYHISRIQYAGETERTIFTLQDSRGRIWVRTGKNLFCLDFAFRFLHKFPMSLGSNSSGCLIELSDQHFLAGGKGLYYLNMEEKTPELRKADPYFDHFNISFVFMDKRKRLWVGSDNGLFLYDPASREKRLLDYTDNVQGYGFYNQGYYLSRNGILYLAGSNGINYLRPEAVDMKRESLHVSLLNMVVNEDDSSYQKHILPAKLSYDQNSIRFDFVAPYFNNPERIHYRYRLNRQDTKWNDIENNTSINFSSLPAGAYHFVVAASLNGSDWFESKAVDFIINPPFWRTWWFFAICLVLASSILYGLYRYRVKQIMKLQMVRNRISAELHDDIGTKLTNINILSTLTNLAIEEPAKAKELLTRISTEVQTSSEALDDIVWNINTSNDSLQEIIPRMRRYAAEVLSGKNVLFNVRVPDNIQQIKFSMEKRHDVYLLFKEIVNNIHKHADARQVLIEIEMDDSSFRLHVKDDGKGFNADQQNDRNGLLNLKMRTERWKGNLTITAEKQKGADINIVLPLKKIHSNGV